MTCIASPASMSQRMILPSLPAEKAHRSSNGWARARFLMIHSQGKKRTLEGKDVLCVPAKDVNELARVGVPDLDVVVGHGHQNAVIADGPSAGRGGPHVVLGGRLS